MFERYLKDVQIQKLTAAENRRRFDELLADVRKGNVFPAVRQNELHFYYKGGCLYKFANGAFGRDKNFGKIEVEEAGLSEYETAKRQNELRFTRRDGKVTERRLLDGLYRHTFDSSYAGDVVVLDIEVDLNGEVYRGKKCDLVLLNGRTDELMFVEGKVFSDGRVNVAVSHVPEVIAQVRAYTAAIAEQRRNIIEQYARHIGIINRLFGTSFRPPKTLTEPAKLLVFETPSLNANGEYTVKKIDTELGAKNVLWIKTAEAFTLDGIWSRLT